MATNVNIYVPNSGEKEALKALLLTKGMVLGLYKNQVQPDGNTIFDTLEELTAGGGRSYARKELSNAIVENALAADKWFVSINALGRAEGTYHNAVLSWVFNDVDVADGHTAYGVFAFSWVLPFDAGAKEIKVGDVVKGATSGATGIVTGVCVQSGTWAAGTAAGYLDIMTKTGTFVNDENILVSGEAGTLNATPTAGGTGYALGDLVEISTGGAGARVVVTAAAAGVVSSVHLATGGKDYTTGTGKATTKITGAGNDDLTVNIEALASAAYAVTNTGVTADAHKRLLAVWAFAAGQAISQNGFSITWDHKVALASGTS